MTQEFRSFIERLGRESRFDRTLLQKTFDQLIKTEYRVKYAQFKQSFQESWQDWTANQGNKKEQVSEFFLQNGEQFIRRWLGEILPFTNSKQQLITGVKSGGTPEDLIFHMFYRFSQQELELLDRSISSNRIQEITRETALKRLFLEAFLPLKAIISSALGYKYSLMIEESKVLTKSKGKIVFLEITARPSE
ncbi:MAG: hypothetical protein LUQ65_04770 [Candidatus Helarchaeota archaeon]|nr:hypothetical protein [Candidatus Helarchaeota archaeon]